MKRVTAIKRYFERDDKQAPGGTRSPITMSELKALTDEDKTELGKLACVELGETYEE